MATAAVVSSSSNDELLSVTDSSDGDQQYRDELCRQFSELAIISITSEQQHQHLRTRDDTSPSYGRAELYGVCSGEDDEQQEAHGHYYQYATAIHEEMAFWRPAQLFGVDANSDYTASTHTYSSSCSSGCNDDSTSSDSEQLDRAIEEYTVNVVPRIAATRSPHIETLREGRTRSLVHAVSIGYDDRGSEPSTSCSSSDDDEDEDDSSSPPHYESALCRSRSRSLPTHALRAPTTSLEAMAADRSAIFSTRQLDRRQLCSALSDVAVERELQSQLDYVE